MTITTLNAAALTTWARLSARRLRECVDEINALNVFPVPDSDTGSNMAATLDSAVAELDAMGVSQGSERGAARVSAQDRDSARGGDDGAYSSDRDSVTGRPVVEVLHALATGAVRGARGNSGVVISQVFRGLSVHAHSGELDGETVYRALDTASNLVYKAIASPVEGTVITVMRAAAVAAADATPPTLASIVDAAVKAARQALAATPSQLEVLREAGVVDAGGRGFVVLLETLADVIRGTQDAEGEQSVQSVHRALHVVPDRNQHHPHHHDPLTNQASSSGHDYFEVMLFYEGHALGTLRKQIATMGDSLVVAQAADTAAMVHVHTYEPGKVLETAFRHEGDVSRVHIEVLPTLHKLKSQRIVVAVTPEGSLADLYRTADCVAVAPGRTSSETVKAIARQIRLSGAKEAVLLSNGLLSTQELASAELAAHALGVFVSIVPVSCLVAGLAAAAVHDRRQPAAVDAFVMTEAARAVVVESLDQKTAPRSSIPQRIHDVITNHGKDAELVTVLVDAELADVVTAESVTRATGELPVEVSVYSADGLREITGNWVEIGIES